MRLKYMIFGELRMLAKNGILFLYGIFTVLYLCLLSVIPESARNITAAILVFTDPAAMGLFFIGAMVLLEKSQRVESSLAVSPMKLFEYIAAKIVPILGVGTAVSFILCQFAGMRAIVTTLLGVALSSILFSLCGLAVGANIRSLNSFMLAVVPFEVVICLPAILRLFQIITSELWLLHPGVAAIQLIQGDTNHILLALLSLVGWIIPMYYICRRMTKASFQRMGGAKL